MSLYDLATDSTRTAEPLLTIKNSVDDSQNIAVFSNSATGASIVLKPILPGFEADEGDVPVGGAPPSATVTVNAQSPEVKSALTRLARFIPTETVTIYLGAISASAALKAAVPILTPELVYWTTGLILTPLIFFLIWAIERTKAKKSIVSEFPYWKLTASIIGFLIWALAVPGNPYATSDVAKMGTAFLALVVSIFLDLIDQFVEQRKQNSATT